MFNCKPHRCHLCTSCPRPMQMPGSLPLRESCRYDASSRRPAEGAPALEEHGPPRLSMARSTRSTRLSLRAYVTFATEALHEQLRCLYELTFSVEMATKSSAPRMGHTGPSTLSAKTQYLVLYNLLSLILWTGILLRLLLSFLLTQAQSGYSLLNAKASDPPNASTKYPFLDIAYPATGDVLRWTQSLALLEVLHAATGLVRTSVLTTGMQVASRLLLVWGILHFFGRGLLIEGSSTTLQSGLKLGLSSIPGLDKVAGIAAQLGNTAGNIVGSFGYGKEMNEVQINQAAYVGMLLAWSITECIRYIYFIYYAGSRTGSVPHVFTWLR